MTQSAAFAAVVSEEWSHYIRALEPIAGRLAGYIGKPEDPQMRMEFYRNLLSQVSMGYFALLYADPEHPDFWPYFSQPFNALAPNPDTDYYVTPIHDDGVYRISGFRGTVKMVLFQIGAGAFIPRGTPDEKKLGHTLANYDLDSIELDADGSFEVILSAERPPSYKGNWWKLDRGATNIFVRQVSYDWLNEVDARLAIERLDRPAVKPRSSAQKLDRELRHLAAWVEGTFKASADFVSEMTANLRPNEMGYVDLTDYAGMVTQRYAYGVFKLAEDEALIVEANPPRKPPRYWGIHLLDDYAFTLDWMNRQTSLNGFTATVDDDGICRVIISSRDPGVANWLDCAGYESGFIQARWDLCETWPEYRTLKVKHSELAHYLPASTRRVSLAERDAAIRLRRKGAQMRKRW
jgi:hypothetical protein